MSIKYKQIPKITFLTCLTFQIFNISDMKKHRAGKGVDKLSRSAYLKAGSCHMSHLNVV